MTHTFLMVGPFACPRNLGESDAVDTEPCPRGLTYPLRGCASARVVLSDPATPRCVRQSSPQPTDERCLAVGCTGNRMGPLHPIHCLSEVPRSARAGVSAETCQLRASVGGMSGCVAEVAAAGSATRRTGWTPRCPKQRVG